MSDIAQDSLKIAAALERLISELITDFETALDVLNLPPDLRQLMWQAVARSAVMKAAECGEGN